MSDSYSDPQQQAGQGDGGRDGQRSRGNRGGGREGGGFRIRLSDNEMRSARALQEAFNLRSTVAVLGFAVRSLGQMLEEQKINIDDLMNAQEVFLTSATGFVIPVIEVNGRRVGNGLVGDMVKKIQRIYIEQIKAKLS